MEYEEVISTIRWELMRQNNVRHRQCINNFDYIKFMELAKKNLRMGGISLKRERKNLFGANDDFYLFHHINDVPYDKQGNLLETKETRKIKELARKHLS